MEAHQGPLYRLTVEIRGAFNDLKALSDAMNADLGITAAMRAVIEYLDAAGPETVPRIAEEKNVTRQHIQQLADALVARGLAEFRDNPGHKRSKFVALTEAGRQAFAEIRRRESERLAELGRALEDARLADAAATLADLRAAVRRG